MNQPLHRQALPGLIGFVGERITVLDVYTACPRADRTTPAAAPYLAPPRPVRVDIQVFPGDPPLHYVPANATTDAALLDVGIALAELDAWSLIVTRVEICTRTRGTPTEPILHLNRAPEPRHLDAHARCLHTVRVGDGRTVSRCLAHGVWLEWEVVS